MYLPFYIDVLLYPYVVLTQHLEYLDLYILPGTARTSLVVTIGPSPRHRGETSSTIMFGQRVGSKIFAFFFPPFGVSNNCSTSQVSNFMVILLFLFLSFFINTVVAAQWLFLRTALLCLFGQWKMRHCLIFENMDLSIQNWRLNLFIPSENEPQGV